jgi:hypothetical protein
VGLREAALNAQEQAKAKANPCSVAILRGTLPPDRLREFDDLIADETVMATALTLALRGEWGTELPPQSIRRHRRGAARLEGGCKCRA